MAEKAKNAENTQTQKRVHLKFDNRAEAIIENLKLEPEQARELFKRAFPDSKYTFFELLLDIYTLDGAKEHMIWEKRSRRVFTGVKSEESRAALVLLVEGIESSDVERRCRGQAIEANGVPQPEEKKEVAAMIQAPATKSFEDQLAELDEFAPEKA